MNRISGLDIYRILCCIGVLGYHVLDDVLMLGGAVRLYYACSFCVPGFFLLSGYLLGSRSDLSVDYSEKKVITILGKLFGWVIFWSIIHLARTGELYDIWTNTSQTIVAAGIEPVAWFICTYCILMIIAPTFYYCMKKWPKCYYGISILWIIILATGKFDFIRNTRPQSLWLHLYLGYFAIGMTCADVYKRFGDLKKRIILSVSGAIAIITTLVYYKEVFINMNGLAPHQNYGTWYYSLWLISWFVLVLNINISNEKVKNVLRKISRNTFSVYLGHLPILLYITAIRPLESLSVAFACIAALFITTLVMAEVFGRLPLLRKIT